MADGCCYGHWCTIQFHFVPWTRPVSRWRCCSRVTATARGRSGRRSRTSCGGDPRGRAPGRARRCRRPATWRASSASRAASPSTPTPSSPPRATWSCGRARGRAWPTRRRPRPRAPAPRPPTARRASTSARACPTSPPSRAPPGCARVREAIATITDYDLGYGDPRGIERCARRSPTTSAACAAWSPTRRASSSRPATRQGLTSSCHALRRAQSGSRSRTRATCSARDRRPCRARGRAGARRRRRHRGRRAPARRRRRRHARAPAPDRRAALPERRAALIGWLRDNDAIAIEDDYDAEFRYDRPAVGALQGLDPERVIYAGSVSKTLAPALRLGWLVVPRALVDRVSAEKMLADRGTSRIDQLAFADFLARGELDRHLRRMRTRYRARRDVLVAAVAAELPEAEILGIAAGLHAPRCAWTSTRMRSAPRRPSGGSRSRRCGTTRPATARSCSVTHHSPRRRSAPACASSPRLSGF